ncbi:MAG: sugar-transfer associated ATP-grasp domain-containing protein [Bacillota bacterium]|nr:sugar-transfer associated ATP-grasp domain-containing protein [Bacillota bacterium]
MNIGYLARVIFGARIGKLNNVVKEIHQKTGKNRIELFFDIIFCSFKYGAGYNDYIIFEFYNMNASQRSTYLTRLKNKKLVLRLNDQSLCYLFDEKNVFDEKFKEFLGREVIDLAHINFEMFEKFIDGKESFFAKPNVGESGKGIEKIKVADFNSLKELYDYIMNPKKNFGVIEEVIVQHEQAAKIYPFALNCLRVVTLVNEGKAHILYAVFKMGNNGHFVDNLENGGLACHFDLDKGEIIGQGHTSSLVNYDSHPYTNIPFIGYKLPFMDEVKELVTKAALVVPDFKYVGWDVCLTPNGPAIVEGNNYPAYDFPQLPDPDKPRIGLLPKIKEFLPDFK